MGAAVPLWIQDSQGAEAYALYLLLQRMGPGVVRAFVDCQATIDGVEKGQDWATDPRRVHAAPATPPPQGSPRLDKMRGGSYFGSLMGSARLAE